MGSESQPLGLALSTIDYSKPMGEVFLPMDRVKLFGGQSWLQEVTRAIAEEFDSHGHKVSVYWQPIDVRYRILWEPTNPVPSDPVHRIGPMSYDRNLTTASWYGPSDLPVFEFALSYGPWKILEADDVGIVGKVFPYARKQPFDKEGFVVAEDLDHRIEHFGVKRLEKVGSG